MSIDNTLRRLRGALGNALVWGAGWFTIGLVLFGTLRVLGVWSFPWIELVGLAVRSGIVGGIAGGVFAGVIRLLYHGRRLSDISWVRFGIGGAVLAGLFGPLLLQTMRMLAGVGPLPWEAVIDDGLLTATLGGIVAAASMRLAQFADALPPGGSPDPLERQGEKDRLALEGERATR